MREIIAAEGDKFENKLAGEDGDEEKIHVGQHYGKLFGLFVVLHAHLQHIQNDDDHDENVETLVGDDCEQSSMKPVLMK